MITSYMEYHPEFGGTLDIAMYPSIDDLLQFHPGWGFEYISNDVVLALLNNCEIISAYAIFRYRADEISEEEFHAKVENLNNVSDKDWYHTKIHDFLHDDCVVISRMRDSGDILIGWLDCDCSDAGIYRISKEFYNEQFEEKFMKFFMNKGHESIGDMSDELKAYHKMRKPLGWISF